MSHHSQKEKKRKSLRPSDSWDDEEMSQPIISNYY